MIRTAQLRRAWLAGLFTSLLLASCPLAAQAPARELLNSERIENNFGSYGISVLQSDGDVRVSKLYSVHDGNQICRTFAVVFYPMRPSPALAEEHALIAAGQSIGATFTDRGWQVVKTHRYFGSLAGTAGLRNLMGHIGPIDLAVHVYGLSVVKDGQEYDYVRIAEVHHPEYLQLKDLHEIYGSGMDLPTPLDESLEETLALVRARMP